MAHTFNWQLGHEGKGNVYRNGTISTWNTTRDENGEQVPHHYEKGLEDEDVPRFHFYISPEGGLWDGGTSFQNQTPRTDDQVVQDIVENHPAVYDARHELSQDWDEEPEERVEMPGGGYGHAYNMLESISKVAKEEGWADFHTELKLPRGIRKRIRRWVDRLDWPEGHEKEDARRYHITILSMDEYDEGFAKWARNAIRGRTFSFKTTGMDIFGGEHVVLRMECPEWTQLVEEWQEKAKDEGLEPRIFDPPKAHVTIGKSPNGKWPQGIPNPHIKFDTRMFNINKNSAEHYPEDFLDDGRWWEQSGKCSTCEGSGRVSDPDSRLGWADCPTCEGTGAPMFNAPPAGLNIPGLTPQGEGYAAPRELTPDDVTLEPANREYNGPYYFGSWQETAATLPQEQREWQKVQKQFPSSQEIEHEFPNGWTVRHNPTKYDTWGVGRMLRNCWQPNREATPEGLAQHGSRPTQGSKGTRMMSLHDEHGIPRAAFYHKPPSTILSPGAEGRYPGGMVDELLAARNGYVLPEQFDLLQQWAEPNGILLDPYNWHPNPPREAMAVDPQFLNQWTEANPYLYHGRQEHPDDVRQYGIDPTYGSYYPTPSVYLTDQDVLAEHFAQNPGLEQEWAEPGEESEEYPVHPGNWVYKIDPRKLDPAKLEADEWNVEHYPEGHEYHGDEYGVSPELEQHLADPEIVHHQWETGRPLAYRGAIPPEAIVDHYEVPGYTTRPWINGMRGSSTKVSIPVTQEWHNQQAPYYHGTTLDNARRILTEGLKPWDSPDVEQKWGNEFEYDWLEPRPGHTYLTQSPWSAREHSFPRDEWYEGGDPVYEVDNPDYGKQAVLKIDPKYLDPQHINPDEDSSGQFLQPEDAAHDTLGQWAEETGYGNNPNEAEKLIDKGGTLAYRGTIPPEAISLNEVYDSSTGKWTKPNSVVAAVETTPDDDLKAWLDSFNVEQDQAPPSLHHTDGDDFMPQIVAPVVTTPHVDPPSKPYKPYDWATEGWEESPLDRTSSRSGYDIRVNPEEGRIGIDAYHPQTGDWVGGMSAEDYLPAGMGKPTGDPAHVPYHYWQIDNDIEVDPEHQRHGVASDMWDALEKHIAEHYPDEEHIIDKGGLSDEGGAWWDSYQGGGTPGFHYAASPEEEMYVPGMARQPITVNPIGWPQTSANPHHWNYEPQEHEPSRTPFLFNRDTRTIHIGRPGMIHGDMYDAAGVPTSGDVGAEWSQGELKHHPAEYRWKDEPSWFTYGDPRKADPDRDEIYNAVQQHVGEPLRDVDAEHFRNSAIDSHTCSKCGAEIDGPICAACGHDPGNSPDSYQEMKRNWYDRAWDEPGNQPRPVPNQPMHWRDDHAKDVTLARKETNDMDNRQWCVGGVAEAWGPSDDLHSLRGRESSSLQVDQKEGPNPLQSLRGDVFRSSSLGGWHGF